MSKAKIYAMYLPQYHETETNSKFWGKGFTDWVSVKKSNSLFEGHNQPEIPLDNNYYDLSDANSIRWQAALAHEYGVDAWGIYHYWFNNEQQELTRPAELILSNKDINMPFFFAWDNASWKRTWSKLSGNDWSPVNDNQINSDKRGPEILVEYRLGTEQDWKNHFDYLLPYFADDRYELYENKPVFVIYRYSDEIDKMSHYWDMLARQNGFSGMHIVYSYNPFHGIPGSVNKFYYEPLYSGWGSFFDRFKRFVFKNNTQNTIQIYEYESVWKRIVRNAKLIRNKNTYFGAFVGYDDSPRRGNKGKAIIGASPELFGKYLEQLLEICNKRGKPFVFLTAWNEWGEGAHLEPDTVNGYAYLEKLKDVKEKL